MRPKKSRQMHATRCRRWSLPKAVVHEPCLASAGLATKKRESVASQASAREKTLEGGSGNGPDEWTDSGRLEHAR